MARKSTKTAHVMNLLAGENTDSDSPKSEAAKENLAANSADSGKTIKELTVMAEQASIQTKEGTPSPSPISIIDMSSSKPDPVAELIKEELEKEELDKDTETISPPIQISPIEETSNIEEVMETEEQTEIPSPSNTEDEITEQEISTVAETVTDEQEHPSAPPAPSYQYLNIMENVVEGMIEEYMGKFQVCTCERCLSDVMALTLNNLSPKYIVVNPAAVSPLLNFYSNRFSQQVIVELTKACTTVKESPRH